MRLETNHWLHDELNQWKNLTIAILCHVMQMDVTHLHNGYL